MVHKYNKTKKGKKKAGIHKLFTPERKQDYLKATGDVYFDEKTKEGKQFMKLWRAHKAKVAEYKGVTFFKNYIPLWRIKSIVDFFDEAEPNVVYAWNRSDLPPKKYFKIVKEVKKKFNIKRIDTDSDPAGF